MREFYDRLTQRLVREPGVTSIGAVNCPPSTGECAKGWYSISEMRTPSQADVPLTLLSSVDPGYFRATQIQLLAARALTGQDRNGTSPVAVVNEKLARHWWPQSPHQAVGHTLKFGGPYMEGGTCEIVGVIADVKQAGLDEEAFAEVHVPFAQSPSPAMVIMIRTVRPPGGLIPAVRRDLAQIDRSVPIQSLRPFEQWMRATLERPALQHTTAEYICDFGGNSLRHWNLWHCEQLGWRAAEGDCFAHGSGCPTFSDLALDGVECNETGGGGNRFGDIRRVGSIAMAH